MAGRSTVGVANARSQRAAPANPGMVVEHLTHVPHDHHHPHTGPSHAPHGPEKLPGITHVIAVGSGKGGVGKSTVSVNLALALQQVGGRVGLVDADILGPSIPGMLGLPANQPPMATAAQTILPAERHGLKTMSMGVLTGDDNPAILRGPMVSKYLNMFISGVEWGTLDYLVIDLPPGTGDTQLTLAQNVPLSGAIIVTTPQDVSLKNRAARVAHVREGASAHPWCRREHEHLHLSALRERHRRLSPWRR